MKYLIVIIWEETNTCRNPGICLLHSKGMDKPFKLDILDMGPLDNVAEAVGRIVVLFNRSGWGRIHIWFPWERHNAMFPWQRSCNILHAKKIKSVLSILQLINMCLWCASLLTSVLYECSTVQAIFPIIWYAPSVQDQRFAEKEPFFTYPI